MYAVVVNSAVKVQRGPKARLGKDQQQETSAPGACKHEWETGWSVGAQECEAANVLPLVPVVSIQGWVGTGPHYPTILRGGWLPRFYEGETGNSLQRGAALGDSQCCQSPVRRAQGWGELGAVLG